MTSTLDIHIPLHKTQLEVLRDSHRFKVVVCGRQ